MLLKTSKDIELYVGDSEGLIFISKKDWSILHLSREFHYKLLGWNLSESYKDHKNYLSYFENTEASINVVNGSADLFHPLGIKGLIECLNFIDKNLNSGAKVYLQCSTGKHLSNSMAMLYLSKRTKDLPADFYKAKSEFLKRLPGYKSGGLEQYLEANWTSIY